ncbi:hypothetical protein [Nonomuraea sp. NPDC050310]|uniref:hypothetical protein n=1 Tax=Nonomuraea sp. NPDC050310 TaxID=3154935 RepID=UPI0033DC2091
MSGFSGMHCGQFKMTVSAMSTGASTLSAVKGRFSRDFGDLGIDTSLLTQLATIGDDIARIVPEARRRLDLGIALEQRRDPWATQPESKTFVPEPPMTLAEAQAKGKELAARLNALNRTDGASAEEMHKVAQELEKYLADPEVMAAFFTSLDPPHRLTMLPSLLYATGSKTAAQDLEVFSKALGVAFSAQNLATPGMDKVKTLLTDPGDPRNKADAWNKLALLQYGKFPTDVVKAVAGATLNDFAKNPDQDFRGGFATSRGYGGAVSEDNVALALNLLGKDPVAARDTLWGMNPGDYRKTFDALLGYSRMNDDVGDALGRAVEAGSGVHDEQPGKHSPGASQFAFEFMLAAGAKGPEVNWSLKDSLSKLGVSYKHELATGARFDDALGRGSSRQEPPNFSKVPGLTPSFYLSQQDTYNFLKTFVDHDQATQDFDVEMGAFRRELLTEAARADADAIARTGKDPGYFQLASRVMGNLAGLEYAATAKVRGDMDESDKKFRGLMKDLLTVGVIDRIPGGRGAVLVGWEALKFATGKGLDSWVEGDQDATRVAKLNNGRDAATVIQRYELAYILLEAGYPTEHPFPPELMKDGKPIPIEELMKDKNAADKLVQISDWMDKNDVDGDGSTFDKKVDIASATGSSREAEAEAKTKYEKKK